MMKDPLLYNSKEYGIEVYLSDIDALLKLCEKKKLLLIDIEKTKTINDIKECIVFFEKCIYDSQRNIITVQVTLDSEIKLSESSWAISVNAKNFCKDIVKALVCDEPTEEFLDSHYGIEFMYRIIRKINKTALESNCIILKEDIAELGFIKHEDDYINTFESCNFSLNRINVLCCSRNIENNNEITKIEINIDGYIISIENYIRYTIDQERNCISFLIDSNSIFNIVKDNTNLKYIPYEEFKSEDEWRSDRLKYISAYRQDNNIKTLNKMFSF